MVFLHFNIIKSFVELTSTSCENDNNKNKSLNLQPDKFITRLHTLFL